MGRKKPIVALMYDFDKTLCTKNMQEYTFIPNVGMTPEAFWEESHKLSVENKMDGILAYMYLMLDRSRTAKKSITREEFVKLGKDLRFYPGVEDWFGRLDQFGKEIDVKIEHYLISSGLREIIEGSSIYKNFDEVFACEFFYDENNVACWPKNVVNYTTKTQFLFRINKGVLDLSNDEDLNKFTPDDDRRVPFRNMIYIGDGYSDVPCMKLVKVNGGYSIAVYQKGKKADVHALLADRRVDFILPADYSKDSELDMTVRDIIRNMAMEDALIRKNQAQLKAIWPAEKAK